MAFMIIGPTQPLFELLDFSGSKREDLARASQFLLHAALDCVDLAVLDKKFLNSTYLQVVDRHNEQVVSAYVTPGGARFLVLHDMKFEVGINVTLFSPTLFTPQELPSIWQHLKGLWIACSLLLTICCSFYDVLLNHSPSLHPHSPSPLSASQDNVRAFCNEVHELYVKVVLNPFYTLGGRIENQEFHDKVVACAKRYLGYKG